MNSSCWRCCARKNISLR